MFFGAKHGLLGVIDDEVRVEHMFFSVLNTDFIIVNHTQNEKHLLNTDLSSPC
jgi:hypothetical protein